MIPRQEKMYPLNTKRTNWSLSIPNVYKIFQMAVIYINLFQSKALPEFTQIGIFGYKINHLATLVGLARSEPFFPRKKFPGTGRVQFSGHGFI
jgi:hypothetical protein